MTNPLDASGHRLMQSTFAPKLSPFASNSLVFFPAVTHRGAQPGDSLELCFPSLLGLKGWRN